MKKIIISITTALVLAFAVSVSTTLASGSCTVTSFNAAQSSVASGGSTTVSWTSSGCDTISINPSANPDNRPPSGSVGTGPLTQTTTFVATGHTDNGGVGTSRSVTITVSNSAGGGTSAGVCKPTSFTAAQTTIQSGGGTVLHWDSDNCDTASIVPADYPGDRPPYGSISTGAIFKSTEYTLTVYDENGNIGGQRFLTVMVTAPNPVYDNECSIDSFNASPTSIQKGDSSNLRWTTTGCDHVTLSSASGNLSADGSKSEYPNSTTTYTLRAYKDDGTLGDTDSVTVSVDTNNNTTCSVDDFSASPSTIDRGNSSTLQWNTSGDVNYVTISGLSGNRNKGGSVSVSPYSTTSYTLRVYCNNGTTKTDTETIYVTNAQTSSAPQAITTVAAVLSNTQARLNGIAVPNTTNSSTTAWFEWGVSGSFGSRTNSQSVTSGNSSQYYSDIVSNLVPGGVYFYRAVVQNQNGIAYGDTVRFQTTKTTSPSPQVVVRSTTVRNVVVARSAASLLELSVESNFDRMCINGQIDYTITYRNISSQTLEKSVLQFNLPKEVTYLTSSRGRYEVVDRTMTIDLGSVKPGEQGIITVHAQVNNTAISGNLTVATATVVYTNTKTHGQEDAIAYSLITVSNDCPNLLGASVFGFGSFLPSTLIGWLLLILVILALIVLARHLYKKNDAN